MPGDVGIRFEVENAGDVVQAFNQAAQSGQQFAQTTQQTVTQARVATSSFSFVLLDMARIARLVGGPAGKEFAGSLDTVFVAAMSARGAVALYRGVLESQEL